MGGIGVMVCWCIGTLMSWHGCGSMHWHIGARHVGVGSLTWVCISVCGVGHVGGAHWHAGACWWQCGLHWACGVCISWHWCMGISVHVGALASGAYWHIGIGTWVLVCTALIGQDICSLLRAVWIHMVLIMQTVTDVWNRVRLVRTIGSDETIKVGIHLDVDKHAGGPWGPPQPTYIQVLITRKHC